MKKEILINKMLNIGFRLLHKANIIQNVTRAFNTTSHFSLLSKSSINSIESGEISEHEGSLIRRPKNFPRISTEDSAKILLAINHKTVEELQEYDITKSKAERICLWKTRNGPFQDLEEILYIEGFSIKAIDKFFQSLIADDPTKVTKSNKTTKTIPFIYPTLDVAEQKSIRSSVALRVGNGSVSWARLEIPPEDVEMPSELTHWEHHEILEKKIHLNDLAQRCLYIDHQIPKADVYIFESPQMAQVSNNPGNADTQNINIQKSQIYAILSYAMAARQQQDTLKLNASNQTTNQSDIKTKNALLSLKGCKKNVLYLRRYVAARLFNHLIGTERVSSEETILQLMRTYYNHEIENFGMDETEDAGNDLSPAVKQDNQRIENIRGLIQFPHDLRQKFQHSERAHREFLSQTLLLNLAFIRLVLLKDPNSLAVFTRHKTNNNNLLPD